jgi:5-formyltetrahydrofolate cyclo-ligase
VVSAKEQLRRSVRRVRDSISPAAAAAAAVAAARQLVSLPAAAAAGTIAVYAPVRGEIDPAPAALALAARGARLVYPRVVASEMRLTFHAVSVGDGVPVGLRPGAFDILEPPASTPHVSLDAIDLFVVPGLAFDSTGARLGWGKGFYDRTLALAPRAVRVGYCFACQVLAHVPHGRDDLPMHYLVTETGASHPGGPAVSST